MGTVTDIDDARPHDCCQVLCDNCSHYWVACFPVGTVSVECPGCRHMVFIGHGPTMPRLGTTPGLPRNRGSWRDRIWKYAARNHPEAAYMTRSLLVVRAILYPLTWLHWRLGGIEGYNYHTDVWTIGGERFTGEALRDLAHAQDSVFRITRKNGCVSLETLEMLNHER